MSVWPVNGLKPIKFSFAKFGSNTLEFISLKAKAFNEIKVRQDFKRTRNEG
jgi:hypothetical protein